LLDAVSARVKIGEHIVRIRGGAGIATAAADATTVDDLLRNADAAIVNAN
jgi:predicted signal transduction protein with EAL and GGDEF domain